MNGKYTLVKPIASISGTRSIRSCWMFVVMTTTTTTLLVFLLPLSTPCHAWRKPFALAPRLPIIRGGYQYSSSESSSYSQQSEYVPPQQQQQQQQSTPSQSYYGFPQGDDVAADTNDNEDPFHETVQDRVNTWKTHQREYAQQYHDSARDEKGRVKLLTSVSKGSRAIIFFFLLWRNVHLYEVADQSAKGFKRMVLATPMILLFLGNLMGVFFSLSSPGHAAKRRLKAILNLDKFVEVLLIGYSLIRLTVAPSKYVPREVFIAGMFHSLLFIVQCQAFTRLSWDENSAQPMNTYTTTAQQQQQHRPSYVEENKQAHSDMAPQYLGDDDEEGDGSRFPYDNPYRRQY